MKKFQFFLCALLFLSACQQRFSYTINGDLSEFLKSDEGVIKKVDSIFLITDSLMVGTRIVDGKYKFSGEIKEPQAARLKYKQEIVGGVRTNIISLILEPGCTTIVKTCGNGGSVLSGTPLNDAFRNALQGYSDKMSNDKKEEAKQGLKEYCIAHNRDETMMLMLPIVSNLLEKSDVLKIIEQCPEKIQNRKMVKFIKEKLQNSLLAPKEGELFRDFEVEYQGKISRLSDYVGKGKYVLVDFWASWCMPCRKEIPNLIAVHNKYKKEGLVVLGVAVSDKPENTQKVIDSEKIPYPQLLNAPDKAADMYDISGIPMIILFDPDGKMVARGLRGKAMEAKLAEIFGF